MKKNKISIFWLLLINVVFIVTIVMSINLYLLYKGMKNDMVEQIKSNVDQQSYTLSQNISTYIDSYAINEYEKLISNAIHHNHIVAIVLKDKNMGQILSKEYYTTGKIKIDNKIKEYDTEDKIDQNILKNAYYQKHIEVKKEDKTIATLDIYISDKYVNKKLKNLFFDIVIESIIISSLLIVILLFIALYYFLFRPIGAMIESISDTDTHAIPKKLLKDTTIKELSKLTYAINKNIIQTKLSNEILQNEKKKYKTILDLSSDALFIMDTNGNLIQYSYNTQDLLGYSDSEMKSLTIYDWDKDVTKSEFEKMSKELTSDTVILERVHTKKDGTTYKAQISSTKIKLNDQDIIYSAVRDITKEYKLKSEILKEKNFVSTIVDNANAIIAVIKPDGTMTNLNKYGQNFTGYSQEEVSSEPFFWVRFLPDSMKNSVVNIIEEANRGHIIKAHQNSWIGKDGKEEIFEWSNTLIKKDDGSLDYIFTIGIDIQEKIEAQNQIIEQNKKLEESEHKISLINKNLNQRVHKQVTELRKKEQLLIQQSKLATMGEMIGHIAHQWRQPLNALSIQKDIIIDDYYENRLTDEEIDSFEKDTNELIQYMSKTIDDFRNFFIPSKKKVSFELVDSIWSVVNIIDAQLKNHHITLTINNNTNEDIQIEGYPNEFKQVVINIINNAKDAIINRQEIKEIKEGKIEINITKDTKTHITIQDNGGGVPDEILHKVFEPYFTTKFQSKGTGLGLYMSKTIIEINMGGTLMVQNRDSGAMFEIVL
jgi:PAS domain S-box-containing protein